MRIIKNIFTTIWRVWAYTMVAVVILVLSPFLLITSLKESWYRWFFFFARIWAKVTLFLVGFYYRSENPNGLDPKKSYMLVANHTSLADILLMLAVVKNPFVFVGKKELAKLPLFGYLYKRTCILVDRSSQKSRMEVFARAQKRIDQGLSICIFPEGGVPADESIVLDTFRDGAFKLAIEHDLPIAPLTFPDNKKRFSYTFLSGSPGLMRAKLHAPIATSDYSVDDKISTRKLNDKTRAIIYEQLLEYSKP
jgi:1-acyl-sn-glycerol-3-phosphate acyltransferase